MQEKNFGASRAVAKGFEQEYFAQATQIFIGYFPTPELAADQLRTHGGKVPNVTILLKRKALWHVNKDTGI